MPYPHYAPIADRDPRVTARLAGLLDDARAGRLQPKDFAYVRAGFFPSGAKRTEERLRVLGPAQRIQLVLKVEQGDDRVFTYEVSFAGRTVCYEVALAPDDRVARFELRER